MKETPSSAGRMRVLQELASALAAALTPEEVAHALVERAPAVLGAEEGAVGLVEGDELVVVDPLGVYGQTHRPGSRFPLEGGTAIAAAARKRALVRAPTREAYERDFPDGAALAPQAQGAIAVPLRVAGEVVGSMSFLFGEPGDVDDESESIAQIAADLGSQALERARLYESERQSREALDRILRVAPRFHADTREAVTAAICLEARATLGADVAEIWEVGPDGIDVMWREPLVEAIPSLEELAQLPAWRAASELLEVTFIRDIWEHLDGDEPAASLAAHSMLWVPIVVGEQTERVLVLSWYAETDEPDASSTIVARRFADQAGIALEELDRRRAQAEATRRAAEAERLQEVTAALSQAATASEVASVCLEHALEAVRADAGLLAVVRRHDAETRVELVFARGYSDDDLASWLSFPLEEALPLCEAIRTGLPVVALGDESVAGFSSVVGDDERHEQGWIALPLRSGGVSGAFQLAFRSPQELTADDQVWLGSLASVCGPALERSRLLEEEHRLRSRSERLQSMSSALSVAVTQGDVARVVVSEIVEAVDASGTALVTESEQGEFEALAWEGYDEAVLKAWLEAALDDPMPTALGLATRSTLFYAGLDSMAEAFPVAFESIRRTGHDSFLFLPLVVGGSARGLVAASWEQRATLSRDDRAFLEQLAGQAAQALDRARRFESERTIAETLQRSVLPESLPEVPGVQLAARYLPGTAEVDVGGDWFDAILLPNGRLGLAVGDVVGKGVHAAATMAQLRNALRAFSLDQMKPSSTVSRLNVLADEVPETAFATMVYVVVDPEAHVCRFTSAGHPPPLVIYPDGNAEYLEGGRGLPLGAGPETYSQESVDMPIGTSLVLYTDGLIERRGSSIDRGLDQLRQAALTAPGDPDALIDHLLEHLVGTAERGDDIAVLALRLLAIAPHPLHLQLPSETDSLELVRDAIRVWLERTPASDAERNDVLLATWEACANAVEHGRHPSSSVFTVHAEWRDRMVRISVEDGGRWDGASGNRERGLGLELMRSLMSSVEIDTDASGTHVRLEKRLVHSPGF